MATIFIARIEIENGFHVELFKKDHLDFLRLTYQSKMSTDIYNEGALDSQMRNPKNVEELKVLQSYVQQLFDCYNRFSYWTDYVRENGLTAQQVAEEARLEIAARKKN